MGSALTAGDIFSLKMGINFRKDNGREPVDRPTQTTGMIGLHSGK